MSDFPVLRAVLANREPKKVPVKLLQCNEEQCQYEYRKDGNIEWANNASHLMELQWQTPPRTILLIKKPNSIDASQAFQQVANFLHGRNLTVMSEQAVLDEFPHLNFLVSIAGAGRQRDSADEGEANGGVPWQATPDGGLKPSGDDDACASSNNIDAGPSRREERERAKEQRDRALRLADFCVCLGGDGTILWVSGMFKGPCPPVVSFAMGSLGFLTPFDYTEYKPVLDAVMEGRLKMGVRDRLECKVHNDLGHLECTHIVLNEVTVDRGSSPFLTNIAVCCNGKFVTSAQGDGLIIATPTGSTAYSLAAGGSMVHPDVPGILLTPICTQSLSFRPIIFPDSVTLKLEIPVEFPNTASVSFDGKHPLTLKKGWSVTVSNSKWPIPILSRAGDDHDWFNGVMECLHWNTRKAQGGFDRAQSGKEEGKRMLARGLV